jgi:hypothetical protein
MSSNPSESRRSPAPAVIGITVAALILLFLGLWRSRQKADQGPQLEITNLTTDSLHEGSALLEFTSSVPMQILPTGGWGLGRFHAHAVVNGVERMPGPADIRHLAGERYDWVLHGLPDSANIVLVWALPNHTHLPEGRSQPRVAMQVKKAK